jgi:hypothetical protein
LAILARPPERIAALLSPGNRWLTGQRIEVSGGLHV